MMMKLILIFSAFLFFSAVDDRHKMRVYYSSVNKEESAVNDLKALSLKSESVPSHIKKAYYAAAEMCSAQYKFNPASKISAFNKGKLLLEQAVSLDTTAIESRYIRFTIQENAPGFLGYNKSIKSDRAFIISRLSELKKSDSELYSLIYAYLVTKSPLNETEKKIIAK